MGDSIPCLETAVVETGRWDWCRDGGGTDATGDVPEVDAGVGVDAALGGWLGCWMALVLRRLGVLILETYLAVGTGASIEQLDMVGGRLALRRLARWS